MTPQLMIGGFVGFAAAAVAAAILIYILLGRRDAAQAQQRAFLHAELEKEREERTRLASLVETKDLRYTILFNNTKDMVFVFDVTSEGLPGRFLEVNTIACSKLEHSRESLLRMTFMDIYAVETPVTTMGYSRSEVAVVSDADITQRMKRLADREARDLVARILDSLQISWTGEFVTRNGDNIPVEIIARKLDVEGRVSIICAAHDITERQEMKRMLRASEQRFQDFFAHSPIGVALYDGQRKLVSVNPACLRMFGMPDRAEFGNFNPFDNPFMPPSARARLRKGETVRYTATLDFREVIRLSLFVSSRPGTASLDILVNNLGVDSDYKPKGYLMQVQDMTDRTKAEDALRQTEKQLRQAEKLEAIGSLAGGIAHDFNNILTPILGYSEIILRKVASTEPVHVYVQEIHKASNRAKDLVNQILAFSRKTEKEGHPMHLIPVIKEVLVLIRASLPETVEINRMFKTEDDVVKADPTQMHQVLMNLCTNAGHAMRAKGGGVLEVWLTEFVIGPRSTEFPSLTPGRYLRISVKDTGTGIPKSVLGRIFEPFFTTKERGEGTGMGLAVVHGIVTTLNGAITVETEEGKGSTFHVVLPLIEQQEEENVVVSEDAVPSGSGCVLFVDDDPDITQMASEMLASIGYESVVCTRGKEALEVFQKDPTRFDAVIADQVMPGMRGLELGRELTAIRPDVPVIICTGFSDTFAQQQAESIGVAGILLKPIILKDLAELLHSVIARSKGQAEGGEKTE